MRAIHKRSVIELPARASHHALLERDSTRRFGLRHVPGVMLGLVFAGGALVAVALTGGGGALTLGVCAWAEWK